MVQKIWLINWTPIVLKVIILFCEGDFSVMSLIPRLVTKDYFKNIHYDLDFPLVYSIFTTYAKNMVTFGESHNMSYYKYHQSILMLCLF